MHVQLQAAHQAQNDMLPDLFILRHAAAQDASVNGLLIILQRSFVLWFGKVVRPMYSYSVVMSMLFEPPSGDDQSAVRPGPFFLGNSSMQALPLFRNPRERQLLDFSYRLAERLDATIEVLRELAPLHSAALR